MGIKIGPQKLILKVLNSIKLPNSIPNESGINQVISDNSSQQSCITSQPGTSTASTLSQPESGTVNVSTIDSAKFSVCSLKSYFKNCSNSYVFVFNIKYFTINVLAI